MKLKKFNEMYSDETYDYSKTSDPITLEVIKSYIKEERRGAHWHPDDYKLEIDKQLKMKQDIINKQLSKGWTQEQAETHALRCLYIDGFSGPTFRD